VNSVNVTLVAPYKMEKCSQPPRDGEGSGFAKPVVGVKSRSRYLHVQTVLGAA
jgi:hypothetical protein